MAPKEETTARTAPTPKASKPPNEQPYQYQAPTHPQLVEQAQSHWKAHEPAMYARLVKNGELNELARLIATQAQDYATTLIKRQGVQPEDAWSAAIREVILQVESSRD